MERAQLGGQRLIVDHGMRERERLLAFAHGLNDRLHRLHRYIRHSFRPRLAPQAPIVDLPRRHYDDRSAWRLMPATAIPEAIDALLDDGDAPFVMPVTRECFGPVLKLEEIQ